MLSICNSTLGSYFLLLITDYYQAKKERENIPNCLNSQQCQRLRPLGAESV